jgi:adenosylcobinamide hydrolase
VPTINGAVGPALIWRFEQPLRSISSSMVGGGIGTASWVLNLTVDSHYDRFDPAAHITEIADAQHLPSRGIGLLTAVDVGTHNIATADGATVCATVGVRRPVWAHDPQTPFPSHDRRVSPTGSDQVPGTINLVCFIEGRLTDAALVNAVMTVSEAKTQALFDREIDGTGTASDAMCILSPDWAGQPVSAQSAQLAENVFGGPRSFWGARLARATYEAVAAGIDRQRR